MVFKGCSGKSAVVSGLIVGLIIQLLSAALIAYLVYNGNIELEIGMGLVYLVLTISSTLGGTVTAMKSGKKIAVAAAIETGLNVLILSSIGILIFDGFGSGTITGLLCFLIGYLFSCAICIMKGKKSKKRKRRAV